MSTPDDTPQAELAHTLRRLRTGRTPSTSQTAAARLAGSGFSQSKVARLESGKLTPTPLDTARLARALGAQRAVLRRAIRLALTIAESQKELAPVRVALTQRPSAIQRRIRHKERDARDVATFHASIVPGLLQTERYMRAMFRTKHPDDTAGADAFVRERLARQAERAELSATQIVTAGALSNAMDEPDVMIEQCEHIAELTRSRPAWTIGVVPLVIPAGARTHVPLNGIDLLDEDTLTIGTTAGNTQLSREDYPDQVDEHRDRLDRARALAVYGVEARAELTRIADSYRRAVAGRW